MMNWLISKLCRRKLFETKRMLDILFYFQLLYAHKNIQYVYEKIYIFTFSFLIQILYSSFSLHHSSTFTDSLYRGLWMFSNIVQKN